MRQHTGQKRRVVWAPSWAVIWAVIWALTPSSMLWADEIPVAPLMEPVEPVEPLIEQQTLSGESVEGPKANIPAEDLPAVGSRYVHPWRGLVFSLGAIPGFGSTFIDLQDSRLTGFVDVEGSVHACAGDFGCTGPFLLCAGANVGYGLRAIRGESRVLTEGYVEAQFMMVAGLTALGVAGGYTTGPQSTWTWQGRGGVQGSFFVWPFYVRINHGKSWGTETELGLILKFPLLWESPRTRKP